MWYVVSGGEIYLGLRRGVDRSQRERAVQDGKAADLVHRLEVKTGDALFVPSGRLHAIGAGNLLIEIQENSDTTFRLFDWNRCATDGTPRRLQIEEALQAIDFNDFEPEVIRSPDEELVRCPHFVVEKWDLREGRHASKGAAFALFVCLHGAVEVNGLPIVPGEFFLVPASAAGSELRPAAPATSLLRITLPIR